MRILAFETSAKAGSVALLSDGKLLGEYYLNCGMTHSRTLLKLAEELLAACEVTPQQLDAVACAAGPGSFTGVRIGVAAAKGFAWGAEKPCVGVSTLEAMAHQAQCFEGAVCCVMDARRAQVYHAMFSCHAGTITRLSEDCAISLEELAERLKKIEIPKIMVGDGAQLCYNTLSTACSGCVRAPEHLTMQRASGVALAAELQLQSGGEFFGATLVPNYLRLSQAERERAQRLQEN